MQAVAVGSATLSWTPPTQNMDGTPLTNLAGYRVYWGTSLGDYPNSTTLNLTSTGVPGEGPASPPVYLLDVSAATGGRTRVRGALWDGVLNAANLDATSDTAGGVLNDILALVG